MILLISNYKMINIENNNHEKETSKNEEKIFIHAYQSAGALKSEIRNRITMHNQLNNKIDKIYSQGPYIYLIFKNEVS